ncbi:MAG TPA: TldD/PmbA family protein [Candidatus Bathyarchaeia archaeon]
MAVLEKNKMLGLAEKAVRIALQGGAEDAEAYVYDGKATNIGIERGQIMKNNRIVDRGLGIRVAVKRAIGFAYTNTIDRETAIVEIVGKALNAARASKPDWDWRGLPGKREYPMAQKTFDERILELGSEDLVNVASVMLDKGSEDKRVFPIEGGCGAAYVSNAVANSNGISGFDRGTMIECSLAAVAKKKNSVTPVCFEFNANRNYEIDPERVGRETARLAISALETKPVETKNMKLVLTQFALQELLYYTLVSAIEADSVQRNQSPFKGKIGAKIASENLTIYDDGLYPGGLRSSAFDGEGVPHQKTLIIEKGVLRSFLYDHYTAKKDDMESTGNASRSGYLSTPSIEPSNFHLIPGTISSEQMISEVEDGLLVYYLQGAHSSNPVSGDFSVVATPAWKIRKGEIAHCSRGVMLAGNIFEVLKNVSAIANNDRQIGQLISPWILVDNVRVIGK